MKRLSKIAISILSIALMTSCGGEDQGDGNDAFVPALDPETSCAISVVGDYDNFEALEAEFDRFNTFYKNVQLSYSKVDDYKNNLATVLGRENERPNIFFSKTWMFENEKYNPVIAHMENLSNPNLKINIDCLRPGLVSHYKNGNVLMVPVFSRTYGMLVNTDLFKKENLNVPNTWDELLTVSNEFANKGYKSPMMGYSKDSSSCLMYTIAYPAFVSTLTKNLGALELANNLDPQAGEYTREALQKVKDLVDSNAIDLAECNDQIGDNYGKVILRFFEGDVPMMICGGDTPSGTKKRESQSQAFIDHPFEYSFHPIPLTSEGGYFMDSPSVEFSVNKDAENLDMTNEFMRFLVRNEELNTMASAKRLVTPTKEMAFDSMYAPFGQIPAERTFSPEVLGIKDPLTVQIRLASFEVGANGLSVQDAVERYGTFK